MADEELIDAPKKKSGWLRYLRDWGLSIVVALGVYWGIGPQAGRHQQRL